MIKKIKNITIFIDDKVIKDAKITFFSTATNITLPHYTVDGELDSEGYNKVFYLMSHGNTTLKSLEERAIKETNERHLRPY